MIEDDRADYDRAKLDHDLIVSITTWAAHNGHEEVVKILLGWEEVNPDKPDDNDQTPLSRAASRGHEGVVKILLEREEVNPNKPDEYGDTPLSCAAWQGHEGVVKMLLEREEVNPNTLDEDGDTPRPPLSKDMREW